MVDRRSINAARLQHRLALRHNPTQPAPQAGPVSPRLEGVALFAVAGDALDPIGALNRLPKDVATLLIRRAA